jgi:hypothetical protein
LNLLMGINRKPSLKHYWSTRAILVTPIFGKHMSRNRFENILRFLHFNNNENLIPRGQPGYDRLFKLRKIIDGIVTKV